MTNPPKTHDSLGRTRRASQGGAGPKHLPDKKNAVKAGEFDDTPPPDLNENGLFWWDYVVRNMTAMGILDGADWMAIALSCHSYQEYCFARADIGATRILMDEGGKQSRHPAFVTRRETAAELKSYLSEFALSPSARAKFGGSGGEDDPWEQITKAQRGN